MLLRKKNTKLAHKKNLPKLNYINVMNLRTKKKWVSKIKSNLHGPKQI